MIDRVFVVMGVTGEYSDRTEWPVCWFDTEAAARDRVVACDAEAKRLQVAIQKAKDDCNYTEARALEKSNQLDPDMQIDYTGTHYYVYEVRRG